MDAKRALDEAFATALKVKGEAQLSVASASLVMHASRTLDPGPFLERGDRLVEPALETFRKGRRPDLELRAAMWLEDGGRHTEVSELARPGLKAYRGARSWAAGGGGAENLAWIREVPRDEALATIIAERLFDHALAAGEDALRPAEAVLEALLADFPRPAAYGLIFRAAALSGSADSIDRTLPGLATVHPGHDTPDGRKALAHVRAAMGVERLEAERAALEVAVQARREDIIQAGLAPHLAAALQRKMMHGHARDLLADGVAGGAGGAAAAVCAAFVGRQIESPRGEREGASRRMLASTDPPGAPALVAGACEAARALRDPWPCVDAARALTGDSLGPLTTVSARAAFQKDLFAAGGEAAAATGDRTAVADLAKTLRSAGLAPAVQVFLRAALADAAAGVAARAGDAKAYDLALKLAGQTRDRFERAKLHGRIAMDFVRASEVPPMPVRWLDPLFA